MTQLCSVYLVATLLLGAALVADHQAEAMAIPLIRTGPRKEMDSGSKMLMEKYRATTPKPTVAKVLHLSDLLAGTKLATALQKSKNSNIYCPWGLC